MSGHRFNPKDLGKLDDPKRLEWLPPLEVARLLGLTPGVRVADVGAGSGFFAIPFAGITAPATLHAVDVQPEMLEILRSKLRQPGRPANIELVEGFSEASTLAAASFDLAFLANVWHEIGDRPAALQESARILAKGGRIAILDWRADVDQPPGPPLDHRVPRGEVSALLAASGWNVSLETDVGRYSYIVVASPGASGGGVRADSF
jgi:ubiquinone/menaquinone biosynthesis C-methylase UbiE